MFISDQELLDLNHRGIIPGPEETEEAFKARADYCLTLRENIVEKIKEGVPVFDKPAATEPYLTSSLQATNRLYDMMPSWIPLFFSNYKLAPWHGGCAWIFQADDTSPTGAFLQLRRAFSKKESYLRIYSRTELIAHELCHVGRMCYEEPKFEEILAYHTSHSLFRRWVGAIAQSPQEVLFFVLAVLASLFADLYSMFAHSEVLVWIRLLPLLLFFAALFRLIKRQFQFKRCLKKVAMKVKDAQKASALVFRLTDAEIIAFSKMTREELQGALDERKGSSLRWRLIHMAYL